jgi:protein involved in polysaccharide export with SLBB domain
MPCHTLEAVPHPRRSLSQRSRITHLLRGLGILVSAALVGAPVAVSGQTSPSSPPARTVSWQRASRTELTAHLQDLERIASSGKLKGDAKNANTEEIADTRKRLANGDFNVGDKFLVTITQDSVRTDTVTVTDSLIVSFFALEPVSVRGVLRSELNDRMNAHVARFLRNVSVRTSLLTRLSVLGAVGRPGFFYYSPDQPISGVVMLAGGPAPTADLTKLEVYRGTRRIISDKDSKSALKDGRTIEELNIQSGDEIRIPVVRKFNWQIILQLLFLASTLFLTLINFLRWYYNRDTGG